MPATLGSGPAVLSSRTVLRVLLVDPAEDESAHLCELLAGQPDIRVDAVRGLDEAAARLDAAAYDAARTDHLTGLFNRRAFDERLRELAKSSARDSSPLTLIVVNVVGTRVVNDAHGYDAGDAMIRRAGAAVARSVRTADYAARIGGDDFGILLPGGDLDLGCRIARRIAHEAERLNNTEWDGDVPVTLTFGLASGVGCDPAELLA